MRVGTLEKLMSAGDSLGKVDTAVEQMLRKVERQFGEVNVDNEPLTVDGEPTLRYMQHFKWNSAKYQSTRPIEELVKIIAQSTDKVELELKEAAAVYQEKKQQLNALQRKKGGNLMVTDLQDIITPEVARELFVATPFLTTAVVVVPKQIEGEWLAGYESLAHDAVGYGPPEDRQSVLGSPVVPRSAVKVTEDRDGFCLYLVVVLRAYVEAFRLEAQARRFLVRQFTPTGLADVHRTLEELDEEADANEAANSAAEAADEPQALSAEETLAAVEIEFEQARHQLARWCRTHYGELFISWMHVKAIRVFVESVLRYGLPVDFMSCLLKPKRGHDKQLRDRLRALYRDVTHGGHHASSGPEDDFGPPGAAAAAGSGMPGEQYFDYVSFSFSP